MAPTDAGAELAANVAAQRQRALEVALESRKQAKLIRDLLRKRKLDALAVIRGSIDDAELADEVEAIVAKWRLRRILLATPGIGDARMVEVLAVARHSPQKRLGELSYEERARLADLVRAAREIAT